MTAAAKLPTCFVSAAAFPLAEAPEPEEPVGEELAPVSVARPVEMGEPLVAVATIVVVQLQSELKTAVV
jgi:hypothetical protein